MLSYHMTSVECDTPQKTVCVRYHFYVFTFIAGMLCMSSLMLPESHLSLDF